MRELRLWYYLECPEDIDIIPVKTVINQVLVQEVISEYSSTFEGCE